MSPQNIAVAATAAVTVVAAKLVCLQLLRVQVRRHFQKYYKQSLLIQIHV